MVGNRSDGMEIDLSEFEGEDLEEIYRELQEKLDEKEERLEEYRDELVEKEDKIDELENLAKKVKADFENYKKRTDEKLEKRYESGKEDLVSKLLEVVDSFEQAIDFDGEVNKEFLEGVKNTRNLLLDKLKSEGLEEVGYESFDPSKHQAIAKVDVDEEEKDDDIVEVVQRGYRFNDKVIRPALVKVKK